METIKLFTYPQGVANKLGQDIYVQRLNELNRFDDCLVVDLEEGDQYFVHPRALPNRSRCHQLLDGYGRTGTIRVDSA